MILFSLSKHLYFFDYKNNAEYFSLDLVNMSVSTTPDFIFPNLTWNPNEILFQQYPGLDVPVFNTFTQLKTFILGQRGMIKIAQSRVTFSGRTFLVRVQSTP